MAACLRESGHLTELRQMDKKAIIRVCICGGGSQSHVAAAMIGSLPGYAVDVLTRRPDEWVKSFTGIDPEGKRYEATLNIVTSRPEDTIPFADVVYICLPGFAFASQMERIREYLRPDAIIGSSFGGSGFFLRAFEIFGLGVSAFCFQRVPAIGRPLEYGHTADIQGYKPLLKVACVNIERTLEFKEMLEEWFRTPVELLSHWLEATLSNSNPLLHPASMSVLFKDWEPGRIYERVPELYMDWTDEASRRWLACDEELHEVMSRLPMDGREVPSLKDYYEVDGVEALTRKIRSIKAFRDKPAPMKRVEGGYQIDTDHRLFTEDVDFGLIMIKSIAESVGVATPSIDHLIEWAQRVMGKEYLVDGRLVGRDLAGTLTATRLPEFLKRDSKA
ncbi:MAG: NAD/NADP octopine/nopaline dehydrogenase [Bacteroidales bacterium]|nr:NAD/NADP octopine/nopaline dehydrogenase [Bacteroidales bacterium]